TNASYTSLTYLNKNRGGLLGITKVGLKINSRRGCSTSRSKAPSPSAPARAAGLEGSRPGRPAIPEVVEAFVRAVADVEVLRITAAVAVPLPLLPGDRRGAVEADAGACLRRPRAR